MKQYDHDRNTTKSLFEQLRRSIGRTNKQKVLMLVDAWCKNSSLSDTAHEMLSRKHIVDVCEDIVTKLDEPTRNVIVKNFYHIIHETGQYFTPLSIWQKNYYREYFVEKLNKKYFSHIEKAVNDQKTLTHLKCLFSAYLRENVHKNKLSRYYENTPC